MCCWPKEDFEWALFWKSWHIPKFKLAAIIGAIFRFEPFAVSHRFWGIIFQLSCRTWRPEKDGEPRSSIPEPGTPSGPSISSPNNNPFTSSVQVALPGRLTFFVENPGRCSCCHLSYYQLGHKSSGGGWVAAAFSCFHPRRRFITSGIFL